MAYEQHEQVQHNLQSMCPLGDHSNHATRIARSEMDVQTLFDYHKDLSKTVTSVIVKVSTIVGIGTGVSVAATFAIQLWFK
jgi:hypothetical protein